MKPRDLPIALTALLLSSIVDAAECEISLPKGQDLPEWSSEASEGFVWVGSPKLAAKVPHTGHWIGMGPDRNYFDKWWWWRDDYRATEEPTPDLTVTATKLDASMPPIVIENATSAVGPGWNAMLVGMEFPAPGCWEVVGSYEDQELRFIFEVGR